MNKIEIKNTLKELAVDYPPALKPMLMDNWNRMIWQAEQVLKHVPKGGVIVDLGSGAVPFMALCQVLGYKTIMADDYGDDYYKGKEMSNLLEYFKKLGVEMVQGDIFADGFADQFQHLDMVTSHDSMEHWHQSPRDLFHSLSKKLNKGGLLWLGVPNCVNLRKRLTVPFGKGKWSQMLDWYETPIFRGHVREPDVGDLHYIAKDLGAKKVTIEGKNWIGYRHPNKLIKTAMPIADKILQLRPSLCSDIYLYAWK